MGHAALQLVHMFLPVCLLHCNIALCGPVCVHSCRHEIHEDIKDDVQLTYMHDAAEKFDPRCEGVFKWVHENGVKRARLLAFPPCSLQLGPRHIPYICRRAGSIEVSVVDMVGRVCDKCLHAGP